jgi:hypothetical protein
MRKRASPRLSKKRSANAALDVDIEYEDEHATETDAEKLGGLDDGSIVYDRGYANSFSPNNDDEEATDDKLDDEEVIMDNEDGRGIVVADGLVEYNDFTIPNTVEHFRMCRLRSIPGIRVFDVRS